MTTVLAVIIFGLACVVGVAGVILPALPGVPLTALGAVLAAWLVGFEQFGVAPLIWVGVLGVLSQVAEYVSSAVGAKRFGASRAGLWGSIVGSLVGLIFFPPLGFLFGAMAGAFAAEMLAGRNVAEATRSGLGALVGTLGSIIAKLFILVAIAIIVFPRLL